jgi:hypothetical protein
LSTSIASVSISKLNASQTVNACDDDTEIGAALENGRVALPGSSTKIT